MFARLLLKSFRGRDSRQLVAFLAVVIAAAVAAALLTITADIGAKINVELRAYGANLILVPDNIEANQTISVNRLMQYQWPAADDTLRGLAPVLYGIVSLFSDPAGTETKPVVAMGADLAAIRNVNPFWEIKPLVTQISDHEMLAGQAAARKLGLSVDRHATLRANATGTIDTFRIAGVISTGEGEDDQFILALAAMQRLLASPDRATLALASVQGGPAVVEKLANDISAKLPEIKAKPVRKIAESEGHVLRTITFLLTIVTAFTVVIATLCLGTTMTALIVERQREVGIMKAIGAETRHVAKLVAAELALIGSSGGIAGYWVGIFLAQVISKNVFNTYASLRLELLPAVLLLALGISLAAMIFPLRRAVQVAPATVLRGE
jgi:putative ABC transport system permease protein